MKIEEWQHIETLFHAALLLSADERVAYLTRACAGNDSLRAEVDSLLAAFESQNGFLEEPALSLGLRLLSDGTDEPNEEALAGVLLGPFKIMKLLVAGGMGIVYLAEDIRLGRKVALKFLPRPLIDDKWAKRQLMKEAQAAAMLDHPNICTIYGFEEEDKHSFIVMQYVEGETLGSFMRREMLPPDQARSFALQIASALAEAHAHGIIHRDIKPQNIMLTVGGNVKVLDFGLAKLVEQQGLKGDGEHLSQTSQPGLIPGTVAYMSPEQLRAERLDYRSDIFSFGTVLFEMLAGKNPFACSSYAETISAILTVDPPPLKGALDRTTQELERIARKCLEKDKECRYQSASELLYELSELQNGRQSTPSRSWPIWSRLAALLVLFILFAATLSFAYFHLTKVHTLAVLPIINMADPDAEPLSDGLTEDLINKLSRVSKLRVKAFTTVSGYKGQTVNPQELGRSLHVDAVLIGTIVKQQETLVLQTSLIDTSDGTQLWGDRYNVGRDQVFDIQKKVSENVTSNLILWVGEDEKRLLTVQPTQNTEALNEYYSGRNLWEKREKKNLQEALTHFQKAIELDAAYARAYAGQADCYVLLNTVAYGNTPTDESMKKARAAALRALEIDESLPEAHTSLGVVKLKYEWNWPEAEREFKRAIALNPDYAWAHYWYAQLLAITGRQGQAIVESQTASDLAPFSPTASMGRCRTFYLARQYDRAAACTNEVLANAPDNLNAQYLLSYVYMQQGMYTEAIGILENLYAKDKALAAAPLGFAYGKSDKQAEAHKVLDDMREIAKNVYLPPQEAAIVYIGLDDKDDAFAWLERSYTERFATLIFLTTDPIYDSLRSDARFVDLVRRLNLTPSGPPA